MSIYFMQLRWIKVFVFLFFLGCGSTNLTSKSSNNWCFTKFEDRDNFFEYLNAHEEHAKNEGDIESMRLVGCAYYQKGDLDLAEQWLNEAYQNGHGNIPIDLTAIYLKEGDLERALTWKRENALQPTDRTRWLDIIVPIERYGKSGLRIYLNQAQAMLERKIKHEGETPMTSQLMETIEDLIEEENNCVQSSDCWTAHTDEKKAYVHNLFQGMLSSMVPNIPKSWNYEAGEVGLEPTASDEEDTV